MTKKLPEDFAELAGMLSCKRGEHCSYCHGDGWVAVNRAPDGSMQLLTCRHKQIGGSDYAKLTARIDERMGKIETAILELAKNQEAFYHLTFRYVLSSLWNKLLGRK